MTQQVKMIDLSKSYVPGDPNSFPDSLHYTAREDQPDTPVPVLMYEGYNFLPTSYGYRSYFGSTSKQLLAALTKPCDEIITFQSKTYDNAQIAFCSDGLYQAKAGETVWTKILSLPDDYTTSGTYKQYTWCIIENNLYIYRQGYAKVIKISDALVLTEHVPSFLNMAGQMGIFRGNGRLCFWDSENSVAWSSALNLFDLTPSIENMVGNSIFLGVLGRIVNIIPHGEGFVIYATRSIVGVTYSTTGTQVWNASTITSAGGITHPKAACLGKGNEEHFVYTTVGIATIGHFNALSRNYAMEFILPELFDYLKESRDPVYLQCHAARYLYFSVICPDYITGITSFNSVVVPGMSAPVIAIDAAWMTGLANGTGDVIFQTLDSFFRNPKGTLTPDYTAASYQIPRWLVSATGGKTDLTARQRGFIKAREEDKLCLAGVRTEAALPAALANSTVDSLLQTLAPLVVNSYTTEVLFGLVVDNFYITNLTYSYAQHLYPWTDIPYHASNIDQDTCWDVFFEFLSKYKETSELNAQYEADLRAKILATPETTYDYYVITNAVGSLDLTYVEEDPVIVPKKSPSLRITLDGTATYPTLQLDYLDTHGTRVEADVARTILSSVTVPFNGALSELHEDMVTGQYIVNIIATISNNSGVAHEATWSKSFSSEPTFAQINSALASNPIHVLSEPMHIKLDAPVAGYLDTNVSSCVMHSVVVLEGITKPEVSVRATIAVAKVIDDNDGTVTFPWLLASTQELATSASTLSRTDPFYYLATVPFNDETNGVMELAYYFGSVYQLQEHVKGILRQYGNTVYIAAHLENAQADKISIDIESLAYGAVSGHPLATHALIGNAVNLTTGESLVSIPLYAIVKYADGDNQDILDFYTGATLAHDTYKLTHIEETTTLTLSDVLIKDYFPSEAKGAFVFTMQALDTYTKQLDNSYLLTASANVVSLAVTMYYGGTFYAEATPTIPLHYVEDWATIFNYDGYGDMLIRRKTAPATYQLANVANIFDNETGKLHNYVMRLGAIEGITEVPSSYDPGINTLGGVPIPFTYPGATYTLQDGVPVPAYPTLVGSLVFDTVLKKWGKQAGNFKALLQLAPINATDSGVITTTQFGMDSGILAAEDATIRLFTVDASEGFCRWGKIGLYRLGFTELLEVTFNFRTVSSGVITVDGSIDARDLNLDIQHEETFTDVRQHVVKCHVAAMWHTISIRGKFDLQYLEFRAIMGSRR